VTNDLATPFTVGAWTNSAGTNVTLTTTNLAAGTNVTLTVNTNGNAGVLVQATNAAATLLLPWTNAPAGGANLSALVNAALAIVAPASETVPQVQSVLRSYFLTGYKPKQANYWELIDTLFWYFNATYTNAVAAATSAAQLNATYNSIPQPVATGRFSAYNNLFGTNISLVGVGASYAVTCNFATPFPNTNFFIRWYNATGTGSYSNAPVYVVATNKIVFNLSYGPDKTGQFGVYSNAVPSALFNGAGLLPYP
jgi:hypothetical protein